jgi:hypothetical protein
VSASVFEAWLLAFLLAVSLALGCLGLLMIGHLLKESWLHPLRRELEAGARTLPFTLLLGLPLLLGLSDLYPWAQPEFAGESMLPPYRAQYLQPTWVLARAAAFFVIWIALALWIARPGTHGRASALGLVLLAATVSLAGIDWISSRQPQWWSSLFGMAFGVSQLLGALAMVSVVALSRHGVHHPDQVRGLTKALLALALVALWLWFSQFLIVWSANLPNEVPWYLVRQNGWSLLNLGIIIPALALAIALLVPRDAGRLRMIIACALLLLHDITYMLWLVRPAAADPTLHWTDPVALIIVGLLWGGLFATMLGTSPATAMRPHYR